MIELINIKKNYRDGSIEKEVLKNIKLEIENGEMLAVMGRSGTGKSTILHIMAGLERADCGHYIFKDSDITNLNTRQIGDFRKNNIGFILQNYVLIEEKNVFENVALPLIYSKKTKKEIKEKVFDLLGKLEILDCYSKFPKELSGGQVQRVAIARALINEPELILADEPTGSLDEKTEEIILDLFLKIKEKGKTLVIVTHDQTVADKCDRIVTLKNGVLV
ncbi:ABC transporter ATP-binding protein [Bacillus velezensis]|uniref:ABC transporter ATP-binding protein n=1 Tax=Bacillus velezensis TaxID=492670 RepID=UPI002ADE001E|nr:ABC transporter ATP-binding protein [Bacillus velezensis]MEA1005309.1 ABC transporter ATP-binding protein [Bacillus velezensis]